MLKIDDSFLINISNAFSTLSELSSQNKSNVHPLFMKDSFYEKDGYLDNYVKNITIDKTPSHNLTGIEIRYKISETKFMVRSY